MGKSTTTTLCTWWLSTATFTLTLPESFIFILIAGIKNIHFCFDYEIADYLQHYSFVMYVFRLSSTKKKCFILNLILSRKYDICIRYFIFPNDSDKLFCLHVYKLIFCSFFSLILFHLQIFLIKILSSFKNHYSHG